jgi:hypothetical protein
MITPKIIKRRSLTEISLLFVLPIRAVSAVGRKFSFKGQVISQSYRIILTVQTRLIASLLTPNFLILTPY